MPRAEGKSQLYLALADFGRNERGLDADRIEKQQDILIALYGPDIVDDETRRRAAAGRVAQLMAEVIEGIQDLARKRAAEVLFASTDRFRDRYVKQRIAAVTSNEEDRAFGEGEYKRLRDWVLKHMDAELPRLLSVAERVPDGELMSAQAVRFARQLYRYAQEVIAITDAFEGCIRFENRLARDFSGKRITGGDVNRLEQGWLAAHGMPGKDLRLVPTTPGYDSGRTLLALAYYQRYRRDLIADRSAREYLRENLDTYEWERLQTGYPLSRADIDVLIATLESPDLDEAWAYAEALSKTEDGLQAQRHWASLLSTNAHLEDRWRELPDRDFVAVDRGALIDQLFGICRLFEGVFPEVTENKEEEYFAVTTIITEGLAESGIEIEGEDRFDWENALVEAIRTRRPARYRLRDDDEPVWVEDDYSWSNDW